MDQAAAYLREIPCEGTRLANEVREMLNALSGDSSDSRESLLPRVRRFLKRA